MKKTFLAILLATGAITTLIPAGIITTLLLSVSGCTPTDDKSELPVYADRFIDEEAGVVCWVYAAGYQGGISCLPIDQTLLELSGE